MIKPTNNSRGEKKQGHNMYIIYCKSFHINYTIYCDTAAHVTKILFLGLLCAISHSHDAICYSLLSLQDVDLKRHQCNPNYTFHVFDDECLHRADNFQIVIFTDYTEDSHNVQQNLLSISLLIMK